MTAWIIALVAAPFVGSFLGVLIRRLPVHRPVAWSRSCCDSCGARLAPRDLAPIVSYAALRGRCRVCRAPIGRFHLWIELAAILVVLSAAPTSLGDAAPDPFAVGATCALGWTLLALAWIDGIAWRLPDALTLPLIVAGLLATAVVDRDGLADHAAAAILAYLGFRAIARGYRALRGREGLGRGDAKLLAAAGAWLGLARLPMVILLAALCAVLAVLAFSARDKKWPGGGTALPFGPFLSLATWVLWLYAPGGSW